MLVGTQKTIDKGRLYRKRLGGGMRQAGVLAAAGLIALEKMPQRLHEDHANAKLIASALAEIPGIKIDSSKVRTNIVIFDIAGTGLTSQAFSAELKARGILANGVGPSLMRMVTHREVTREMCVEAVENIREIAGAGCVQAATHS
jgi:threonine aldolase